MANDKLRDNYGYPEINLSTVDAFGRMKVANGVSLFDSKQIFENNLFFDNAQVSGSGGNAVYSANRASTTISVSENTAGVYARQTFRRFNYQPAKSHEINMTFVMGSATAGVTKRVGYFDDNNGIFLEQNGDDGQLYVVIRSNVTGTPTERRISQFGDGTSDTGDGHGWNIDKMNGRGLSSDTLDIAQSQILYIDFEWLGVGSVRFGFVIGGVIDFVHKFNNSNELDSVYMSTPNLPVRYEIEASGTNGADDLECICVSVQSDGGADAIGASLSIDRGNTLFDNVPTDANMYALISLRLKSTHLGATVLPNLADIICTTNAFFRWSLLWNPTVGGTDNASWVSVANSAIEYDISRDNTNPLTGGRQLAGGYGTQTADAISLAQIEPTLLLGATIDGTRDELVLAVQNITGSTNEDFYASIGIRELA